MGYPDVATAPGGYIWDLVARKGLSFRNYGFFMQSVDGRQPTLPRDTNAADDCTTVYTNQSDNAVLYDHTDINYYRFDLHYADSDAWVRYDMCAPASQVTCFGDKYYPSRFQAWHDEFQKQVASGTVPRFTMLRMGRDHTLATTPGASSPRAMIADNDYAVGQVVEAISNSPVWLQSAIFILEDDPQSGVDHVDCHRSFAQIISPYTKPGILDSTFYNTASLLRTMELLMGLPPMNTYDGFATVMDVFAATPVNAAPYTAVLPPKEVICEVNHESAYRAADSARMFNRWEEESGPDAELAEILWRNEKGADAPVPPVRHALNVSPAARDDDD